MLVTCFCMLVTFQSVINIIICQNVLLVTDMLCWRHEIQPGAKFNKFFPSFNRSWGTYIGHQHQNTPECDVGYWYLMLVPNSRCCYRNFSPTSKSCHQQIWCPTSVTYIDSTFLTLEFTPGPDISLKMRQFYLAVLLLYFFKKTTCYWFIPYSKCFAVDHTIKIFTVVSIYGCVFVLTILV